MKVLLMRFFEKVLKSKKPGTKEKVESTVAIEGTEDQSKEEIATPASQTSTQTHTSIIFGDDETIATLPNQIPRDLLLKDHSLTLKPLPKIDPKDKGKKKIKEDDESESEDDDIPQAVMKFKQLESDEELARKVQEDMESGRSKNEADKILAEKKLQSKEREQFTKGRKSKKSVDDLLKACGELQTFLSGRVRRFSKGEEIKQGREYKEKSKKRIRKEENSRKRKQGTRKQMKSRKEDSTRYFSRWTHLDTEKENGWSLRLCLDNCSSDCGHEVDYEIIDKKVIPSLTGDGISHSHANREEVSFEDGILRANDKAKLDGNQLTLLLGEELASPRSNSSCLPKTVWLIKLTIYSWNDEELSIPEQTATGKGTSNPLMADKDAAKEG
ncbi:hypothetical protein Tco_0635312 [Tanacetum coccineum]